MSVARHDSAHLHVSGRANYTDDIPLPANTLHAAFGTSAVAHGQVIRLDLAPVKAAAGVVAVFAAQDVPGENNYGSAVHDSNPPTRGSLRPLLSRKRACTRQRAHGRITGIATTDRKAGGPREA